MRRLLAPGIVLAAAAIALAGPVRAADALHVGKASQTASATLPVDVGIETGLFAKHGLDVQLTDFEGSSRMHQAMVAGNIDIGVGAGPELVLIAKGSPELAVCDADPAPTFLGIAVPEDSPIHTLAELKGKKMSVSSVGGLTYWLALELARKEGWGEDGITMVTIGNASSSVVAALQRTHRRRGLHFDGARLPARGAKAGAASRAGLELCRQCRRRHDLRDRAPDRDRARRGAPLPRGLARHHRFMRTHKAETVKIESAVTGFPPSGAAKGIRSHHRHVQRRLQIRRRHARELAALLRRSEAVAGAARHVEALYRGIPAETLVASQMDSVGGTNRPCE